jgi:dihydrodipicolinate synthase/N-acetylneuraminate lyase
MQPANLLAFYRTVADRSPIPVLIYSVPIFTKYDMPPELVIEVAEHRNIIGIKESGGDAAKIRQMAEGTRHIKRSATVTETFAAVTPRMLKAARSQAVEGNGALVPVGALAGQKSESSLAAQGGAGLEGRSYTGAQGTAMRSSSAANLKTRQKEVGFQILAGAAQRLLPALEAGAVGAVLAFADPAPTACYEVYAAWKEGDQELACLKQERISSAAARVGAEIGIPGLKYAMDLNGYYGGTPRLPLLPLTAELKAEVERLMADIRN